MMLWGRVLGWLGRILPGRLRLWANLKLDPRGEAGEENRGTVRRWSVDRATSLHAVGETNRNCAIEARSLVRAFGENRAVDGVDLVVDSGEIYGFLGPNGAGKSTTVRMLCTLLKPTSGRATVAGFDVVNSPGEVRIRIGVAMQEAALDERQTGREILDLQARLYGLSAADRTVSIARAVDLIDIGDAIDDRVKTYSGGMKRRLDLAASLIHGPELLFLDEPTTGLDPVSRAQVWDEVRRLNREFAVTVFLTTQYLEEADALADRGGHHRRRPHRRAGITGGAQACSRCRRHRCRPRGRRDRGGRGGR